MEDAVNGPADALTTISKVVDAGPVLHQFGLWARNNQGYQPMEALSDLAQNGEFGTSDAIELAQQLIVSHDMVTGLDAYLTSVQPKFERFHGGEQPQQLGIAEYLIKRLTEHGRTTYEIVRMLDLPDSYRAQVIQIRDAHGWRPSDTRG